MKTLTATYSSTFGNIVIESDGEALTGLRFGNGEACTPSSAPDEAADNTLVMAQIKSWLDDYFAGKKFRL